MRAIATLVPSGSILRLSMRSWGACCRSHCRRSVTPELFLVVNRLAPSAAPATDQDFTVERSFRERSPKPVGTSR
jgi:hypothetical protein